MADRGQKVGPPARSDGHRNGSRMGAIPRPDTTVTCVTGWSPV